MTLEEAIAKAQLILPEHKKEFTALLEKFPHNIDKWIYDLPSDPESLNQGDILIDMPVCFIDDDGDTVKGTDYVAMVSNACDMQPSRKETVIASPIVILAVRAAFLKDIGGKDIETKLQDIRENKIFSFFYLPARDSFPESYIDFSRMITVNSNFANRVYTGKRILSLSQYGFYLFLIKLTFHLARMEYPVSQN
ncbi:MAG: hypothetical protein KAJ10_13450 [Thermodesulfovibrionia bacterium]|nr:hypothetical protein [Thermodesulfovibrionia bacterium]